jgi:hypothetical protein
LAGVFAAGAAGVEVLPDPLPELSDDALSDDDLVDDESVDVDESDDVDESVDVDALDDDFDLPPRLSVL